MRRFLLVPTFALFALLAVPVQAQIQPGVLQPVGGPIKAGGGLAGQPPTEPVLSDEEALTKAGLNATDGPKLLGYLRQRTLSDVDQGKINAIIKRFGADDFDVRVKATEEIEAFGPAAVGPLKAAERDPDPEIAYRARITLKRMEKVPHSAVAAAAVRAVAKLKPEGAAAALMGFLPVADTEVVANTIREALVALAVGKDGKADPAIVAALTDNSPMRRSAAYVALTEGGQVGERIRIKDAYPKLREAVLKDTDTEAKFAGLWSLTMITREKEFIPELIGLIPTVSRGRIWQLEELLLQLAGTHPKEGRFLKSSESLGKARDAWLGWWKEKGEKLDFVKFDFKPRIHGFTDIIEMDYRGYGQGRIVSLGPDLKEKWRINGINNPTDVKVLPTGKIWVVESNMNQVTERNLEGTVLSRRNAFQQPLNIDFLPDGGMVVICRNQILEWDKDGKQVWAYQRPNYDIMTGRRLPNGETIFVTNAYQNPGAQPIQNVFRIDSKGKDVVDPKPKDGEAKKPLTFGYVFQYQNMDVVGEDKVLVCERENKINGQFQDRVAEYDLKTGKMTWKHDCPQNSSPTSAQRLVNGNTLICLMNTNQLIEVDPSGEVVWDYQSKDGLKVGRAYRR
jgi:PQQ-like domain